ncbi:MAG: flippase-like domain-containing protein [Rhodospirillales bacterium]|nr:flippase-like domain-containing protein [Rhodospirillales bacterium]
MLKKWLSAALKLLISIALIWFLIEKVGVDLTDTRERLLGIDPWMLALGFGILTLQVIICVFRWRAVLGAINTYLSYLTALRFFMIGSFFNQVLPSSVGGDAVRIYKSYQEGLPLGRAINGVMLERVATVIALVIVVLLVQPFFLPRVGEEASSWIVPGLIILALAAVGGLVFLMVLDRLPSSISHLKIVRGLALVAADTRKVFLTPLSSIKSLSWAALGHVNLTLGIYILALGLELEVTWIDCLALLPPVILVTTIPISLAGWGVREGAMVWAFALIGVPKEGSLALSVLFGLVTIVISLPGAVLWLMSGGRKERIPDEISIPDAVSQSRDL